MKKILNQTLAVIAMCLLGYSPAKAQTYTAPANPDVNWVTSSLPIKGINTAMIEIYDTLVPANSRTRQLAACAYSGVGFPGGDPGGIEVTDLVSGFSFNVAYPTGSSVTMINQPDIILGNNTSSATPTLDFIMAVIYVDNSNQVRVDYFDINYTGPGVFAVNYNSTNAVPLPPGYTPLGNTHIDVIADHSVTPLYLTLPVCDRFGITFDAVDGAGVYNVFADYGTLNTYSLSAAGPLNISLNSTVYTSDNWQPDVAAIQRTGAGGGGEDVLLLTFTDQNLPGRHLFFLEWNITAGSFWPPLTPLVMDWVATNPFYKPRIDGNDNLATNGGAGAQWKVAVETQNYYGTGTTDVRAYDMVAGYGGVDISAWLYSLTITSAPYTHHVPAVAFGPNVATQFMVTEGMEDGTIGNGATIMSPFDQTWPFMVALDPSLVNSFFEVNMTAPENTNAADYTNSVSTSCNYVDNMSLVAWAYADLGGTYYIDYKTTTYGGAAGYTYKPVGTKAANQTAPRVRVYPNPANEKLTIEVGQAGSYTIHDALGRVMAEGMLVAGEQAISLQTYPAGTYIIALYSEGKKYRTGNFVKQE